MQTIILTMLLLTPFVSFAQPAQICGQIGTLADTYSVIGGEYIIQNNVWGAATRQCVDIPDNNATGFSVSASNHNQASVASYPSVFKGCHWGNCSAAYVPAKVNAINTVPVNWLISNTNASGAWNAAIEVWFSPIIDTSQGYAGGGEVMIWLDYQGMQPSGFQVATVTIGGFNWEVWYSAANSWSYVAYRPATNATIAFVAINLQEFFADASSRGYINNTWYLHVIEAGFEIMSGGQGLTTNAFAANINTTNITAPVITMNGAAPVGIAQGAVYNDAGATAVDDVDGDVSASIITVNQVDTANAGTYFVTYDVSDAAGNAAPQMVRTVRVIATGSAADRGVAVQLPLTGSSASVEITSAGEVISNLSSTAASGTPPAGVSIPFGVLGYTTTVAAGSTTQTVNLSFSSALPAGFNVYKVDAGGNYSIIPNGAGTDQWTQLDASTIALTLTDGGRFDLDGIADGVIIDPLTVGVPPPPSAAAAAGGSGGCVVIAMAPFDPVLVIIVMLSLAIRIRRGRVATFSSQYHSGA